MKNFPDDIPDLRPTDDIEVAGELVKHQGFAVLKRLVPTEQTAAMVSALEDLVQDDIMAWSSNPNYRDAWMVMNLMFRDRVFVDLLNDFPLRQFATPIIGPNAIIYSLTSSSMPPSESNFSRRIHVDSPRFVPGYPTNVGVILPLSDFTRESGGTEFLPFSHRMSIAPSQKFFENNAVIFEAEPGQALLFNARLWHSGGLNQTTSPRHAITINLCRSFMRQHFDFSRMVNDTFRASASPTAYSLIGWDVRMPSSLAEYYVEESQRLYKPNQG